MTLKLSLRVEVWERDERACHYCGKKLPKPGGKGSRVTQVDHIIPQAAGGSDEKDNLVISCKTCNRAKGKMKYSLFLSRELARVEKKRKLLAKHLKEVVKSARRSSV